jgi:hypothetical protein
MCLFRPHVEELYDSVHNMIAIGFSFQAKLRQGELGETAMRRFWTMIEALVFVALPVEGAIAQYTIQVPGEAPTSINRTPNGGTVRQTPGQAPSFATPTPDGGYVVHQPGMARMSVTPLAGGGYVMKTPGQTPTYAIPRAGGGYMIEAPGQAPTFVSRLPF